MGDESFATPPPQTPPPYRDFSFGKDATAKTKKELPSPSLTKVSFQALPVIRPAIMGDE